MKRKMLLAAAAATAALLATGTEVKELHAEHALKEVSVKVYPKPTTEAFIAALPVITIASTTPRAGNFGKGSYMRSYKPDESL